MKVELLAVATSKITHAGRAAPKKGPEYAALEKLQKAIGGKGTISGMSENEHGSAAVLVFKTTKGEVEIAYDVKYKAYQSPYGEESYSLEEAVASLKGGTFDFGNGALPAIK